MLLKLWDKVSYIGTPRISNKSKRRNVVVSNRLITIVFLLNIVLYFFMLGFSSKGPLANMMIIGNFVSYGVILGLTHFGFNVLARILFSLMVSVFTFATTLFSKIDATHVWDDHFFSPRIYITMTAIIPVLIFSTRNTKAMLAGLSGSFFTLLLFDPIHNLFGVGYYQSGHSSESYPFVSVVTMACYLIVIISLIGYRRVIEKYEKAQIEAARVLEEKNTIIEEQKSQLEFSNVELNEELKEKNKNLLKNVSELRQFSYTLSHNLRSPVASLLGLTNLIEVEKSDTDEETRKILTLIKKSTKELDETISDLGNLLEIKDDVNQIKEGVSVDEEIEKVLTILHDEIEENEVKVHVESNNVSSINSVRAYVHSILYNLISNAIKFNIPGEKHIVEVITKDDNDHLTIRISDNGIGMDLERYGDKLFKMYKRLNLHASGKGLGLYITYYQVEALNGSINVTSAPGEGASFIVKLPKK